MVIVAVAAAALLVVLTTTVFLVLRNGDGQEDPLISQSNGSTAGEKPKTKYQTADTAKGNDLTIHNFFQYPETHIALGDNREIHQRIVHQITTTPFNVAEPMLSMGYAAPIQ